MKFAALSLAPCAIAVSTSLLFLSLIAVPICPLLHSTLGMSLGSLTEDFSHEVCRPESCTVRYRGFHLASFSIPYCCSVLCCAESAIAESDAAAGQRETRRRRASDLRKRYYCFHWSRRTQTRSRSRPLSYPIAASNRIASRQANSGCRASDAGHSHQ